MRSPFMALAASALLVVSVVAQQDEKVVPVHEEPRHRLVLDRPETRILDIQIPPGDTTLFHTHSDPILYVNMASSQTRSQTHGREWSGGEAAKQPATAAAPSAPFRPGRMNSVTSYSKQPLTHRVNNVGQSLFRLIGIINRSAGDASTALSADFATKPEVDNPWFRGYRWELTATEATHRHANPVAIVLVAGRARVSAAAVTALDAPGAFAFIAGDDDHRLASTSGAAEVVEIEIRRPR
jgi:quercetin dioxygenase-like cupin family protein